MPSISHSLSLPIPPDVVYGYLKTRYFRDPYRSCSLDVKGRLPPIALMEDVANRLLAFEVPGFDPILRISVGGWRWTYEIQPEGGGTRVTIRYTWSWFLAFAAGGTARGQAANELIETVMALDALAQGSSGESSRERSALTSSPSP